VLSELLERPAALALSVAFHLVLIGAIIFNLDHADSAILVKQANLAKTVKAEIVDVQQLEAREIEKKKAQEAKRKRELEKRKREKEAKKREAEKKSKQAEEKKRKIAAEKKKKEEAKRVVRAKKLAQQKKKKLADEQKKKQLAQLKKQQEAEKQKKLDEEKRILEDRLAREAEQKRIEAEKLRQEAENRRLAEQEQKRRQQELNKRLKAEESQRRLDSLRQAYILAIKQKIERNWRKPQESGKMPDCTVKVVQGPGGIILDVGFGVCQATTTYRLSIENAVYKADPLPLPGDASLFERELDFLFKPE